MKKRNFQIVIACIFLLTAAMFNSSLMAQGCNNSKVVNTSVFPIAKLETKWTSYVADKGFATLLAAVKKEGFIRIEKNEKAAWGFDAGFIADTSLGTSEQKAEVCSFDFYRKTDKGVQMCTMVWRKVGSEIYKAYIVYPVGEKNIQTALEKSDEFYVDENNKIQKAHSFGKCWAKCVFKRFNATACSSAMAACGGAAAGLTLAGIGVTTPIALGIFGACAGVFCLAPLAICAAYCL
jgi:hypothetical protein